MDNQLKDVVKNLKGVKIAPSTIHGHGLFATQNLLKGDILGQLDGQLISWELHEKLKLTYEWNALCGDNLLVRPYRTFYSYINHSRDPNLVITYNPIKVLVKKNITKGEELTIDYREEPLPEEYLSTKGRGYL